MINSSVLCGARLQFDHKIKDELEIKKKVSYFFFFWNAKRITMKQNAKLSGVVSPMRAQKWRKASRARSS